MVGTLPILPHRRIIPLLVFLWVGLEEYEGGEEKYSAAAVRLREFCHKGTANCHAQHCSGLI